MRRHGALVSSGLLLLVVVAWLLARGAELNGAFLHDDAFITLRYAQNWLAGNGIAWNPGDRVEGYTNFLQLALVTGLARCGVELVLATRIVALVAYVGVGAFLIAWLRPPRIGETGVRGWVLAMLPIALCLGSLPLVAWGYGGLEAPLLTLWLTIGFVVLHDAREAAVPETRALIGGFALALAVMTRPDAGLFVVAAGCLLAWPVAGRIRWRVLAGFALPLALLLAPWLAWKLAYYGSILPNTFHVKATEPSVHRLTQGLRYVGSYAGSAPFLLPLLAVGALRAAAARRLTSATLFGLACIALHLGWVIYIGGDQMPMSRLLVPVVPIAALLCLELFATDLRGLPDRTLALVPIGVACALGGQLAFETTGARNLNSTAFVGAAVGDYIADAWRPGSLVALNTAGSTPYHAPGFRYVDMLGLNDAHIAKRTIGAPRVQGQLLPGHAKGDGAYVLSRQPDYVILGPAHGAEAHQPWFLSDLEIAEDPRFQRQYVKRSARLDVRDRSGWASFPETRSGVIYFTWYERRAPPW